MPAQQALRAGEPPSPIAFDLYAAATVEANVGEWLGEEAVRTFEREAARMLTYYPDSFLVNLDLGYLYLYAEGRATLAEWYSRRALNLRPQSGPGNYNLACALGQQLSGDKAPTDPQIDPIIRCLEAYLAREPTAAGRLNAEGDFIVALKNEKFRQWFATATVGRERPGSAGIVASTG